MTKVEFGFPGRGGIGAAIVVGGRLIKTKFGFVGRGRVGVAIAGVRDETSRSKA